MATRSVGISNEKIGDALVQRGELYAAMRSYPRGTRHSHLAKADPNNTQWRRDLSVSHEKIGNVLVQRGKSDEAQQSFRDGLAIVEHLALADPNNTQWQYDLGDQTSALATCSSRKAISPGR